MPINPKDPEDSAGHMYNWLVVNQAQFIKEREYYFPPLACCTVYQLWQLSDGEYTVREASYYSNGKPVESEAGVDSINDFRQYVRDDIAYYHWLQSPGGEAELAHLLELVNSHG
jgi:hypothetical protein